MFIQILTKTCLFMMHFSCLCMLTVSSACAKETTTGLSERQKAIIPISAHTAIGNMRALEQALNDGLNKGLTVNEIKEIFIHSYAYAGFPRALNGINTFISVIEERKARGITDTEGAEPTPEPHNFDANVIGNKIRNDLVGRDISNRTTGYAAFVPTIDTFLIEHLFADIFYRDLLSIQDRELITISMLSAMSGAEAQLTSHMKLTQRVGYTSEQLREFTQVLNELVGQESAIRAQKILSDELDIAITEVNATTIAISRESFATMGPADKFTGKATITSRFTSPASSLYRGAMVGFERGARTAWHTHPKGQTLIIISGKGMVQQEGRETKIMLPGDVVTIPPKTKHWHGAAADSAMSHIAISSLDNGETVTWMELVKD